MATQRIWRNAPILDLSEVPTFHTQNHVDRDSRQELLQLLRERASEDKGKCVARVGNFSVAYDDIQSLLKNQWLTAPIINAYLAILQTQQAEYCALEPRVLCLDSSLLPSMRADSATRDAFIQVQVDHPVAKHLHEPHVQRVLVPSHVSTCHWALVDVDVDEKRVSAYDSIKGSDRTHDCTAVLDYMEAVARAKGVAFNRSQWRINGNAANTFQGDAVSCGMYTLLAAEWLVGCATPRAPFNDEVIKSWHRYRVARDIALFHPDGRMARTLLQRTVYLNGEVRNECVRAHGVVNMRAHVLTTFAATLHAHAGMSEAVLLSLDHLPLSIAGTRADVLFTRLV